MTLVLKVIVAGIALVLFLCAAMVAGKTARRDRDWDIGFSREPAFEDLAGGRVRLRDLRDFEFGPDGAVSTAWRDVEFDPATLAAVWFFLEPFPGDARFAHSFLSFVFEPEDGPPVTIAISVEARKEQGERYSPLRGILREYELLYVWSTEKDILTRIAVGLDHRLYAYKLNVEPAAARAILDRFQERTNALAQRPRFYNTLTSNCTNELAKAVNDAFPRALPWRPAWIATGGSAAWLHRAGFIGAEGQAFEAVHAQADIQLAVKASRAEDAAVFSSAWRAAAGR